MAQSSTREFVRALERMKAGDLAKLRAHALVSLDESVQGFDLFSGLWWPLRQRNQSAPRREVAWLIAKLYGFCRIEQKADAVLATSLGKLIPREQRAASSYRQRFDRLLISQLDQIESPMQWALLELADGNIALDWEKLTDDLSIWERPSVRERWAKEFLGL